LKVTRTELDGLIIIEPAFFEDDRGFFMEAWHHSKYKEAGVPAQFVQDNISLSKFGVLRGLHFQSPGEQGKLVSVLKGEVFDVAVDIRVDSPTYKKWVGVNLSESNRKQLWIPPGFAHGFTALSDDALFLYKCSEYYNRQYEHTLRWDDPDIGIDWPGTKHIMSEKDAAAPYFRDLTIDAFPKLVK